MTSTCQEHDVNHSVGAPDALSAQTTIIYLVHTTRTKYITRDSVTVSLARLNRSQGPSYHYITRHSVTVSLARLNRSQGPSYHYMTHYHPSILETRILVQYLSLNLENQVTVLTRLYRGQNTHSRTRLCQDTESTNPTLATLTDLLEQHRQKQLNKTYPDFSKD